ncbi:MAG TPA: alpha/beta fold hydrolase [Burkholderiales bacterium]
MIEIETGKNPVASVIWLHGLGADGHDFEPVVPELRLKAPLRFVFPHAPVRPVTINNRVSMRAWYDILQLGPGPEDEAGIRAAEKLVVQLIEAEKTGKIFLAGFSQGGAVVLQTALRYPRKLAGVLALSTYLPLATKVPAEKSEANQDIPIFMAHGTFDPVIPMPRAVLSRETLLQLGYRVEWHEYPMPHSVCGEEIAAISAFLAKLL